MATYFMIWNPDLWPWTSGTFDQQVEQLRTGASVGSKWSTGNTKRIAAGDRLIWLRVGSEPRGIFATGRATSECYTADHWDPDRAGAGDRVNQVDVEFDELVNPWSSPVLPQAELKESFPDVNWSPAASGIELSSDVVVEVELAWQRHLQRLGVRLVLAPNVEAVQASIASFSQSLDQHTEHLSFALYNAVFFVFDPSTQSFGPSKWCAFKGMTPEVYLALQRLQRESGTPRGFNGGKNRWQEPVPCIHATQVAKTIVARFGADANVRNVRKPDFVGLRPKTGRRSPGHQG